MRMPEIPHNEDFLHMRGNSRRKKKQFFHSLCPSYMHEVRHVWRSVGLLYDYHEVLPRIPDYYLSRLFNIKMIDVFFYSISKLFENIQIYVIIVKTASILLKVFSRELQKDRKTESQKEWGKSRLADAWKLYFFFQFRYCRSVPIGARKFNI